MNIYITLDYELFFGKSGSVDNCIINPTNKLLEIVNPYNIKLNLFVDVGYLVKLKAQKNEFSQLEKDYQKVSEQLQHLSQQGHCIELHIHPHWEDSYFDGKEWVFDTSRYKLKDFPETEVHDIVTKYTAILKEITGKNPVAYRAGGWSIQPFKHLKKALADNDVFIDSTVFPQGYHNSKHQFFDFRKVPQFKTHYRFSDQIDQEDSTGKFTEIPISSYKVSPLFFWKFALKKLQKSTENQAFGNGYAVAKPKAEILRMLTTSSYSVASIDGYKTSYLEKSFRKYQKNCNVSDNFVIIGHPKAFSLYSLKKTKEFIKNNHQNNTFKTFCKS